MNRSSTTLDAYQPLPQNFVKSFNVLLQKHPVGFNDFILGARAYGNPTQILTELVFPLCMQYKNEKNTEGQKLLGQLLEEWLRTSPDDLKPKSVSSKILECTEHDKELTNKIKLSLLKTGNNKKADNPTPQNPPEHSHVTELVLSLPAEVLAATFSHIEQEHFKHIPGVELIAWYLSKEDRNKVSPHVVASIDRFNQVSRWIAYTILKSTEEKERIKLIEKFISVARKCETLSNFNTLMQIICSLNNTMISRLSCWEKIDSSKIAEFQNLEELMSPMKNFGNYREQFKKRKPQVVPYFPIVTRDITFAFEMSKYVDDVVNWNLLNSVGFIIREFKNCQTKLIKFNTDDDFEKIISVLPIVTEEELEQLSFLIQPSIYQTSPLGSDSDFFSKSSYTSSDSKSVCSEDDDKGSFVDAPLPTADLPEVAATEPVPRRKRSVSSTRKRYVYCESVRIPSKFESTFVPAEKHVKAYFNKSTRTPFRGELRVGGQRYLAIRTDSLSNDFLRATQFLLKDNDVDETGMAGFMYQIAYLIGKADAEHLACGFMFPAYLGNARMCLRYQSETEKLKYIFSYTCLNSEKHQQCLHCAWTSAYSSGWISEVAGKHLQSAEVTCLCRGHKECCSILAPEADLAGEISSYINENKYAINNITADSVQILSSLQALEFQRDACEANSAKKKPKLQMATLSRMLTLHKESTTLGKQTVEEFANWNQQVNQAVTKTLFPEMKWNVKTGTISFNNEGYFLLNSGSFFVDLYNDLKAMGGNEDKGHKFALSTLYEICEYMGTADCLYFCREKDSKHIAVPRATDRDLLISKLCAIRSFFAQCGWGRLVFRFESFNTIPAAIGDDTEKDLKHTALVFEIQNSCEAEAWQAKCCNQISSSPTCICMCGYVAGWLTYAFGTQMVVSEVTCASMDHNHCVFIAAIPSRIKTACSDFVSENKLPFKATNHLEKYLKQVTFA